MLIGPVDRGVVLFQVVDWLAQKSPNVENIVSASITKGRRRETKQSFYRWQNLLTGTFLYRLSLAIDKSMLLGCYLHISHLTIKRYRASLNPLKLSLSRLLFEPKKLVKETPQVSYFFFSLLWSMRPRIRSMAACKVHWINSVFCMACPSV